MDKYRRFMFLKYEIKRFLLKNMSKNETLKYSTRYYLMYHKSMLIRFSTIGQQRNRCVITGRVHNVLAKPKYSRFVFRTESYHGSMPGCKKAS